MSKVLSILPPWEIPRQTSAGLDISAGISGSSFRVWSSLPRPMREKAAKNARRERTRSGLSGFRFADALLQAFQATFAFTLQLFRSFDFLLGHVLTPFTEYMRQKIHFLTQDRQPVSVAFG
jgi:hypothetical protein